MKKLQLENIQKQIELKEKSVNAAAHRLAYKQKCVENIEANLKEVAVEKGSNISISTSFIKKRLKKPTSDQLSSRSRSRRRNETINICHSIHGGSNNNLEPSVEGVIDTLAAKCTSKYLSC